MAIGGSQVLHDACEAFDLQRYICAFFREIDPLHKQLHDPRLLGREQLGPNIVDAAQFIRNQASNLYPAGIKKPSGHALLLGFLILSVIRPLPILKNRHNITNLPKPLEHIYAHRNE